MPTALPSSINTNWSAPTSCASPGRCSKGLSNGAKAGISVGAAAAGLASIAILVAFIWRHRRRRSSVNIEKRMNREMPSASTPWGRPPVQELEAREKAELDSRARVEMAAHGRWELK